MGKIEKLPTQTVNQIAAGEVVERPASVIKELIENSLDAGADEIDVEVEKGGKEIIKVSDNGEGMSKEDLELAFEKHATSKIEKIEDLDDLSSLGFRGEALPSIAAVSKVRAVTKQEDDIEGTEIVIEGGEVKSIEETGCAVGTTVEVKDLFYNTPARKKYLKKTRTESAHVNEIVTRNALVHPGVHFSLIHNGKEVLSVPKTKTTLGNVKAIYGKDVARKMVKVSYADEYLSIEGFVSKPEVTRSNRDHIYSYVNSRFVENRLLKDAIVEGYGTLLPKKRYPIVVLELDIDGEKIDVNVHPTKTKIRFLEEQKLKDKVSEAINSRLLKEDLVPSGPEKEKEERVGEKKKEKGTVKGAEKERTIQDRLEVGEKEMVEESKLSQMRVVGIVKDSYIVTETPEGLSVIDQHAAHERINYENLKKKFGGKIGTQELVSPNTIELNPKEAALLKANEELLRKLGFHVEPFGKTTFRIRAVPVILGELQEEEIIRSVLNELTELEGGSLEERREELIKYMACHSSVTAGDKLSRTKAKDILEQLGKTENPYTCPHGRPTIVKFSEKELKKWFKRT